VSAAQLGACAVGMGGTRPLWGASAALGAGDARRESGMGPLSSARSPAPVRVGGGRARATAPLGAAHAPRCGASMALSVGTTRRELQGQRRPVLWPGGSQSHGRAHARPLVRMGGGRGQASALPGAAAERKDGAPAVLGATMDATDERGGEGRKEVPASSMAKGRRLAREEGGRKEA
jgi:hypothetical protein